MLIENYSILTKPRVQGNTRNANSSYDCDCGSGDDLIVQCGVYAKATINCVSKILAVLAYYATDKNRSPRERDRRSIDI